MKHNDLSNQVGYTIAFRCEDCLLKIPKDNFIKRILQPKLKVVVNEEVAEIMNFGYRHTEYTVDLVVKRELYTERVKVAIEHLPYNRVLLIEKDIEVHHHLVTGDLSYYVDTDPVRRSLVNSVYAINLEEAHEIIRRGRF